MNHQSFIELKHSHHDQQAQSILKYAFAVLMMLVAMMFSAPAAKAAIEVYEFDSPQQEAQYKALIEEFRCPKCQNQNLAGSDSIIAQDLKRKTYEMVMAGQTDAQIREYMYERYGDFISYKPPVRPSTWILWYFPPLILLILIIGWLWRTKMKNKPKLIASESNAAAQTDTSHNHQLQAVDKHQTNDIDDIGSNLSEDEAAKLKTLLDKHNNVDSNVDSTSDKQ